ncbi:hypothetical protein KEM56_004648 [Ascosphaera pollenicola]|nr:hypothetical protein KEM56_004648 [Ascosphaera pollenicola]
MAPIAPNRRDRTGRQIASFVKTTVQATADDHFPFQNEFKTNKKDKRQIKHETFLSKIEKSRSKKLKRWRPSKKLVANLDSLADALPTAGDDEDDGGDLSGSPRGKRAARSAVAGQMNIIKQKSLKHKPGCWIKTSVAGFDVSAGTAK